MGATRGREGRDVRFFFSKSTRDSGRQVRQGSIDSLAPLKHTTGKYYGNAELCGKLMRRRASIRIVDF